MAAADYRLMTEATGQRIATALEALGGGKLPLNFATLDALPSTVTTGDVLPVERGTTTYKIDYNALAAAILARLGAGSDNIVDVTHGGTSADTRLGAQHELMAYGAAAATNDNPATYGAGIYHLGSSAFDTSYWPAGSLWGVMMIWSTQYYTVALILHSGTTIYCGFKDPNATTFAWKSAQLS